MAKSSAESDRSNMTILAQQHEHCRNLTQHSAAIGYLCQFFDSDIAFDLGADGRLIRPSSLRLPVPKKCNCADCAPVSLSPIAPLRLPTREVVSPIALLLQLLRNPFGRALHRHHSAVTADNLDRERRFETAQRHPSILSLTEPFRIPRLMAHCVFSQDCSVCCVEFMHSATTGG
jgi:hypothetical protein